MMPFEQCRIQSPPFLALLVGTSLEAALVTRYYASLNIYIGTSLKAALLSLSSLYAFLNIRLGFFGNRLSLVSLIFTLRTGDRN